MTDCAKDRANRLHRLFKSEHPDGIDCLHPESKKILNAQRKQNLRGENTDYFQFQRHEYVTVDTNGHGLFRTVNRRDSWTAKIS